MTTRPTGSKRRGRPANTSTDDTVAAVLVAARRHFAAHGYTATSNQALASSAGLAHTAIYNHFGSKAALFTAVFVDVQDSLIEQLERSSRAAPDEPPFPRVLLDAIEALRDADPSYVEFLASMYTEVRRHTELRDVFQGGERPPIFDTLRGFALEQSEDSATDPAEDTVWFWIAVALGLAQLSTLADPSVFADSLQMLRRRLSPLAQAGPGAPTTTTGGGR